jgi:hypothetical protein
MMFSPAQDALYRMAGRGWATVPPRIDAARG